MILFYSWNKGGFVKESIYDKVVSDFSKKYNLSNRKLKKEL
jgi:hypothetical protein